MGCLEIKQADRMRFERMLRPCLPDCPDCHGSCLLFTGYNQRGKQRGYGSFKFRSGRTVPAHRFAYFAQHSLWLLPGGDVCHVRECGHRACCKQEHVYLDTHRANQHDVVRLKTRSFPAMPVRSLLPILRVAECPAEQEEFAEGEIVI